MIVVLDSFLLHRQEPERRSFVFSRRRGFRLEPRHLLIAVAAGCLALAWARARRRRPSAEVRPEPISPAPARRPEPMLPPRPVFPRPEAVARAPGLISPALARRPEPMLPPRPIFPRPEAVAGAPKPISQSPARRPEPMLPPRPVFPRPEAVARAPEPVIAPVARTVTMPAWASLATSTDVASHWLERADQAAHMGRPWALRRIAGEMERAGQEVEAGLLKNYALLLEHSRGSRARVRAEVTRMLQAAMAQRRSVLLPRRSAALARGDASAQPLEPTPEGPFGRTVLEVEPLRTLIERSLPVADSALPVEGRRRAGR